MFHGDFGVLKQTLTHSRGKSQGDFQGSRKGTLKFLFLLAGSHTEAISPVALLLSNKAIYQ